MLVLSTAADKLNTDSTASDSSGSLSYAQPAEVGNFLFLHPAVPERPVVLCFFGDDTPIA